MNWLGEIVVGQGLCSCRLSEVGSMVEGNLLEMEKRYVHVEVKKYVVMPNHVHAIIALGERREQSPRPTTLADVVCAFKSIAAKAFSGVNSDGSKILWQKSFHDHIIRDESEYQLIWKYIDENPARWREDCYFA